MVVGDKYLGKCESVNEVFPEAKFQRCTVHFYRNVFSATPRNRMREVTRMLKARKPHAKRVRTLWNSFAK